MSPHSNNTGVDAAAAAAAASTLASVSNKTKTNSTLPLPFSIHGSSSLSSASASAKNKNRRGSSSSNRNGNRNVSGKSKSETDSDSDSDSDNDSDEQCRNASSTGNYHRFWATASPSDSSHLNSHTVATASASASSSFKPSRRSSLSRNDSSLVLFDSANHLHVSEENSRAMINWRNVMTSTRSNINNGGSKPNTLGLALQNGEIPGIMGREHQSRILFVSLLENYCRTYDDNPLRNRRLFFAICRTLYSMGIIGKEYVDEMASVRSTYSDAFRQLVAKAQESLDMYEHHDIESGIRSLMTGIAEEEEEDTSSEMSDGVSGDCAFSSAAFSESDNDFQEDEKKRRSRDGAFSISGNSQWTKPASTLARRTSLRNGNGSGFGAATATISGSTIREPFRPQPQPHRRITTPHSNNHTGNSNIYRRGSISASPGGASAATFGSMVMDMQRSRYHDDFVQLRCLGKGGFGKVYEVRNKLDGRRYAVKLIKIRGEITADKTLREIKTLANLDHPNIVRYYSSWIEVSRLRSKSAAANGSRALSSSPLFAQYDPAASDDDDEDDLSADDNNAGHNMAGNSFDLGEFNIGYSNAHDIDDDMWVPAAVDTADECDIVFEVSGGGDCGSGDGRAHSYNSEERNGDYVEDCSDDDDDTGIVFAHADNDDKELGPGLGVQVGPPSCRSDSSGSSTSSDSASSSESDSGSETSSISSSGGSSDSDNSDSDSNVSAEEEVLADALPRSNPIPIALQQQQLQRQPPAHYRRRSVHTAGPFTPRTSAGLSANRPPPGISKSNSGSQARSLPTQSFESALSTVTETTLFVQMQLCQTTLEEFLVQRNTRIAEHQAAHALECFDECDALDIHGGQLIDPVLNVRLFRSIVEGVKYFHSRDVIHRDLKGANVFLDIVYADSGGNPMSRSASGIGRPGNSSQSVVPFNISQVNSMTSGIGDVHADAWDAIDGGNLKERPGGSGDNLSLSAGSRKIDWDAVFECMVAGSAHNRAAPMPGFCLSTSSSSSSRMPPTRPVAPRALQRESSGLAVLVPRHPLVTFIPRIGDFGLATKSTLGIRSSGSDGYAFIGGQSKTAPVSTCLTPTASSLSTNTTDRRTSNVGTVTYAAPEQLCEQLSGAGYNEKADIYSLGIIFFELYYAFSTFMERIAVFKDLRKGVFPPEFLRMWPKEAAFILRLMDANPDKRLSAKEILALDMFDVPSVESAQLMREVLTLKQQLMLANQRNEELGLRVRELERIVDLSVRSD